MKTARRFRDCEIHRFVRNLILAFHLAIVSVIIVETMTPSYYEFLFPQSGLAPAWIGGAGRLILVAQNKYAFQIVAGCIWVVLFFDYLAVEFIESYFSRRWLRYY